MGVVRAKGGLDFALVQPAKAVFLSDYKRSFRHHALHLNLD
jgi:hypothetical protein